MNKMPTNEERREAVKRLREDARLGALPFIDFLGAVAYDVAVERDERGVLNRLADLIEPEPERKAKARPFPVEKDTRFFDTTKCECGYLNDVSATYCGQCGCVIEVVHYAN